MNFLQVFITLYEGHLPSYPPIAIRFSYADVQFDKMHTQKCGNFEKTIIMTSSHGQCLYFRTCLNNVNVSKGHFECDQAH